MRRMRWPVYLWPGLPQIVSQGSWTVLAPALTAAVVASIALNAALVTTLVWRDVVTAEQRIILWVVLLTGWIVGAGYSFWFDRRDLARRTVSNGSLFESALDCYLKGNWFEAERSLYRILRDNDHDLEARLMLATLFRHTKRFDEATRQLNLLARLEGAYRWALEIQREGQLLTDARRDTITGEDSESQAAPVAAMENVSEAEIETRSGLVSTVP